MAASWSIRSVLVSVSDLECSLTFYTDVTGLREIVREGELAILGEGPVTSIALVLREASQHATRHGQQALGARAVCFNVGTSAELDRVQQRLEAHGKLHDRRSLGGGEAFDVLSGRDPDGLPLVFISSEAEDELASDHYRHVGSLMYGLDV